MNARFTPPPKADAAELLGPLPARRIVKKAVILAAGRGRRMGKLTKDRPKAALVVGDHALIDWQIAALQAAGVEEIAVVTGHGAQALAGRGVTYIHNPNWASGTQVETLLCASDWIGDEPVIVSYGDIIYHPSAPLALLERPGDIIIAYDADHRWLWKKRFGNWLKDSETFHLGPGQVLTEIGGKPTDIEELDGQFMGLMLFTPAGLAQIAQGYRAAVESDRRKLDFTRLFSSLLKCNIRIDTAVNLLPWMEVDGPNDLNIANRMTAPSRKTGRRDLIFPPTPSARDIGRENNAEYRSNSPPFTGVEFQIDNAFTIQNWGRSGSTFLQTLLDDHRQILSTPNFYSRAYYVLWASRISCVTDAEKPSEFLQAFQQWWDAAFVDASAGLHRLGDSHNEIAGVERELLEAHLRTALARGRPLTRRGLFEAAHLAYALARGQTLASEGLQILFPVHGEARGVAAALLEDFPNARFIHTIREPTSNLLSVAEHIRANELDIRVDPIAGAIDALFSRAGARYGRTCTAFGDRPYFPYLARHGQVLFLKLEDLHAVGLPLVRDVATWLHLRDDRCLSASTCDGKIWWNRTESQPASPLGRHPDEDRPSQRLSERDRHRIWRLARATPLVRAAYQDTRPPDQTKFPLDATLPIAPWSLGPRARRSELRCVEALLVLSHILPPALNFALAKASRRLHHHARLVGMASGARAIRKHLPKARLHEPVSAILLLSPTESGWSTRAFHASARLELMQPDEVSILFLDEATRPRSISHTAFWALVLVIGWPLACIQTYIRIRTLMLRQSVTAAHSARGPPI